MKLLGFKKAQSAINIFLPIISLFFFGVVLLISGFMAYSFAATLTAAFPTVSGLSTIINQILEIYGLYDYVVLTLSIFFIIAVGYTSYRIRANPMYYIITIFVSAFYGFVAYILSYIFSQFASNPIFITILHLFPLTIIFLTNLHWIALVMILVGAISLYSNSPNQQIPLR